jgi:hypothetical protein
VGLSGVKAIAGGMSHSLALKNDGTVVGWGSNQFGQASPPEGLTGVVAITAGFSHSVALKSDGTVVAWGFNNFGIATVPVGLSGVKAIAAGYFHSLALFGRTDSTAPLLTVPEDMPVQATSALVEVVTFNVTATDDLDPSPQVACIPASGMLFPLGSTLVTCTATDATGNVSSKSFVVSVVYSWSGVKKPIDSDGTSSFKAGSTIPVKFSLTGPSSTIFDAVATLSYARLAENPEIFPALTNVGATVGNQFRFTDGQYIFNWSTKGLATGPYALMINLGDGVDRTVHISLR